MRLTRLLQPLLLGWDCRGRVKGGKSEGLSLSAPRMIRPFQISPTLVNRIEAP
jgi:hypothetical protein